MKKLSFLSQPRKDLGKHGEEKDVVTCTARRDREKYTTSAGDAGCRSGAGWKSLLSLSETFCRSRKGTKVFIPC